MRNAKIIAITAVLFLVACGSSDAAIISINYTGTYTGTWSGNYDPLDPAVNDFPGSGTYSTTPFSIIFTFDTSLTTANLTPSHLADIYTGRDPQFPSVGTATFVSSLYSFSGAVYSADDASTGQTSQTVIDFSLGGLGYGISITAVSPNISPFILQPLSINSGLNATGSVEYDYGNTFLGGGFVNLDLTAETLKISVSPITDAVPEPSTWAMLLIGFAIIAFISSMKRDNRIPLRRIGRLIPVLQN